MTTRAVIVGLNKFVNFPESSLQMCVADAITYKDFFIKSMTVDPANTVYLIDSLHSKQTEVLALEQMVKASQPGDVLLWARSSHGTTYQDAKGMTHEALVCYDTALKDGDWDMSTLLTGPEAGAILAKLPKGSHAEIWWDLCFSGLGFRVFGQHAPFKTSRFLAYPGHRDGVPARTADRLMVNDMHAEIILWAACSGNQTAADAPSLGNGAFTHFWMQSYKPKRSRTDIIAYTRMGLRKGGFDQNPHLECDAREAGQKVGA